jgi:glycosyltransferase involved in cell wall biosynthesis
MRDNRLRIAIVNETWTAGATRCALDLVHGLRALGHEMRYYPESTHFTKANLLKELSSFKPHVVHLHSFYGHFEYQLIAEVSQLYPTCFTPHDPRPIGTMAIPCWDCQWAKRCLRCPLVPLRRRRTIILNPYYWQRRMKRKVHSQCSPDLFLAFPSAWIGERFKGTELVRFPSEVIPNGVDIALFWPVKDAKERLGWSQLQPTILYLAHSPAVGATDPRKGHLFLAKAFVEQVLPQHPTAKLMVIGEGMIGNHPQIQGLGIIPHDLLPLYYSAADIFVAPTLADNLPYSILEAMACGKPVIASRVGGVPEEVEHGVTGLLVQKANVQELGSAILQMLENPEAAEMGNRGRKRVEEHFSMGGFIERYESLYRKLSATTSAHGVGPEASLVHADS